MYKKERYFALILLVFTLLFGKFYLENEILFFRLLVGGGLGYALSRSFMGFAGSVNRAYQTGSTKLMRTLMFMFFITALFSTAVLFNQDASTYDLWVNPINLGLILGGILFGFGMVFSSCCASGVLTDLVEALPRAFITLVFFCFGVFIGFPLQRTAKWINESWVTSTTGEKIGYNGVYLPDLFKNDGLNGYLGAIILTGILCLIVVLISYAYEKYRKDNNTYTPHLTESIQLSKEKEYIEYKQNGTFNKLFTEENYQRIFARPWTLQTGAIVITGLFLLLMGVTKAGWGASTPYGFWFGKLLMLFGVSADQISSFTNMPTTPFTMPFFSHPINVQNIGIVIGTLLYTLSEEQLYNVMKASRKITFKQSFFFGLGGFCMGFGTRLSNGCNVGALYTPIANFSLSGWIFLIFLVIGGILGNKILKISKI